ncbi:ankyrin repeat domain-containing protein [Streptosporangium sp. NPDC006013]|uniref:ankyrin repeat domain-containing protein n=1 Tax=Streptosporangium sp. NPDC006013 TaxID=3155596 RepID=UPI0033A23DB2
MYEDESALHDAAEDGSPEEVAELAGRVEDVDAMHEGRTALWVAVYEERHDNARALVAAGADPWRPMMSGWSPGRLTLAGPEPDLFGRPSGVNGLTDDEAAAVVEAERLRAALGDLYCDGTGLACVAGIDAAEAVRRLEATVEIIDPEEFLDEIDPFSEESMSFVGVTDVPGGCVVTQPWGYMPQTPGASKRLSAGTVCYGLYANPKSGNQGSIVRDGEIVGWDLHPGGTPWEDEGPLEVLFSYLYRYDAVAYSCAYAGLQLTDARAVTGPPDVWLRLPERGYWR